MVSFETGSCLCTLKHPAIPRQPLTWLSMVCKVHSKRMCNVKIAHLTGIASCGWGFLRAEI